MSEQIQYLYHILCRMFQKLYIASFLFTSSINKETKEDLAMGRLVFDVDDSVHVAFKVYCLKNGTSMTKHISDFMKHVVEGSDEVADALPMTRKEFFDVDGFRKALNLKNLEEKEMSLPPFLRKTKIVEDFK